MNLTLICRSQVADLQMWCRSVGLGGPRYEYVETNRGVSFITIISFSSFKLCRDSLGVSVSASHAV